MAHYSDRLGGLLPGTSGTDQAGGEDEERKTKSGEKLPDTPNADDKRKNDEENQQNLRQALKDVQAKLYRVKNELGNLEDELTKMNARHFAEQLTLKTKILKQQIVLEEHLVEKGRLDGLIEALEPPQKKAKEN